jgi:hypothetical protein
MAEVEEVAALQSWHQEVDGQAAGMQGAGEAC